MKYAHHMAHRHNKHEIFIYRKNYYRNMMSVIRKFNDILILLAWNTTFSNTKNLICLKRGLKFLSQFFLWIESKISKQICFKQLTVLHHCWTFNSTELIAVHSFNTHETHAEWEYEWVVCEHTMEHYHYDKPYVCVLIGITFYTWLYMYGIQS